MSFRLLPSGLLAGLLAAAPLAVRAASSALDADFVAEISPGLTPAAYPTFDNGTGAVNATALQSDGKILAGGNVSRYQTGGALTALKRLLPTGALDPSFNSGGTGLAATSGQPEVNALLVDADDRIYVGGTFSSYNETSRSGILRLLPNGALDTDFASTGLGGVNRYAQALALQPDGKLLVGGAFNSVNASAAFHLTRLLPNGALDVAFNSNALGSLNYFSAAAVRTVALLPDGRILVGGLDTGSRPLLLRLFPDGTHDASFAPGFTNAYGAVNKILPLLDGRVLVAGFFTPSAAGQEVDLAAFHADGSLDTAFFTELGEGPNGSVLDLKIQPDGTVLAAGIFNLWDNQPRASLARLSLAGELLPDPAPLPYTDNRDNAAIDPLYLTHFYSLAIQPDGKLVAGGWFSRITDPALETYNLTRFVNEFSASSPGAIRLLSATATTAENAGSITLQVSRFGGTTGAVSVSYATATGGANGTATAGSDYTTTTGTLSWAAGEAGFKTITIPILQDAATESPETFTVSLSNATGGATIPATHSKTVVTIRDDDSAPVITQPPASVTTEQGSRVTFSIRYDSVLPATIQWQYDADGLGTGADFANIPGATGPEYTIAVSDPSLHNGHYRAVVTSTAGSTNSTPAELFVAIPAGSVDTTFVPPALSEAVNASALDHLSRHLVASQLGLRRYTVFGELDSSFAPASFSSTVTSVYPLLDGRVLVGGFFATVNGTARATLARFSATGVLDTSFSPSLPTVSGTLYAQSISPGAGNKYYVGFGAGGGLRRYHADGTHDTSFTATTVGTNNGGIVYAVRERADGRVLVAHISGANGSGFTYTLSLLEANGTASSASLFTPVILNNSPRTIDLLPDGRIALGGQFATVNGVSAPRVVILHENGAIDPTFQFATATAPDSTVHRVIYRDGRLLLAGEFANIGGQALRGVARVNLDGSLDSTFSPGAGTNNAVLTAHLSGQNDLFIAGNFTSYKGVARNRVALVTLNPLIGAIGFAPARVETHDAAGVLPLTLRRYGPATEAVSIRYTTVDGTATAGTDFTAATGTVSWAAGDLNDKTISIALTKDSAIEPTETFRVVLSDPVGPVSPAASATITLLDGDTPASFATAPQANKTNPTPGEALTITANVTSPTPATYQWFRNGIAIAGQTSPTLSIPDVAPSDAGLYTLVATNAAGTSTSEFVHIVITPLGGRPVPGQSAAGRPQFDSFGGPAAMLALPDGGALLGGTFAANITLNRPQAYILRIRADGTTDASFTLALNSSVVALREQPDGKILVLGNFSTVNGATQRYLVRLNANLTLDTAFNTNAAAALTSTNIPGNYSAMDLAIDSQGRIYLAYSASPLGFVRRLTSTGTLDTTFLVGTNGGTPSNIAVDLEDRLLVGGSFGNIGPIATVGSAPTTSPTRSYFARLSSTGEVDATFVPNLNSTSTRDILVHPTSGRIFVGLQGAPGAAEILADGSATITPFGNNTSVMDTALSPSGNVTIARSVTGNTAAISYVPGATPGAAATQDASFSLGTGSNGNVTALAYRPDGTLWIAGGFTTINGVNTGSVALLQAAIPNPGIVNPPARIDVVPGATAAFSVGANGTNLAYQWLKNGAPLSNDSRISGATTAVLKIANVTVSDDTLYSVRITGGSPSTTIESTPVKLNVLGTPTVVASPANLNPVRGQTATLAADVLAATPATYVWKRDGVPLIDGGRYSGATTATLVIADVNNTDNGAYTLTVTNGLGSASTTPATVTVDHVPHALDSSLSVLSATNAGNASNYINTFLHLPDGRTLIGGAGSFKGSSGNNINAQLVVVDPSGNLTATPAGVFNGEVNALARLADGKILVGGNFTTVAGVAGAGRTRIARLNADLTLDTTFLAVGPLNAVSAVHADAEGNVYLGGSFANYGGQNGYNYLVRLLPDGSLDTSFNLKLGASVSRINALPDGRFYVSGFFDGYGSPYVTARGIIRFLADGTIDPTFTSGLGALSYSVNSFAIDSQGRLVVAGPNAPYVVRLLSTGALDSTFTFGPTLNTAGNFVVNVTAGDKVLLGGGFTSPSNRLLRLNADGSLDTAFAVGTGFTHTTGSPSVTAISIDPRGRVWIGGKQFTSYNGVTANAIAVLQGETSALGFSAQPLSQTADLGQTATFSIGVSANNGYTVQWLKNGSTLANGPRVSGATSGTLTLTGLVASDAAAYSARVTSSGTTLTSAAASLTVLGAPQIVTPPADATCDLGGSVTLSAKARGSATLAYQWLHNGAPLSNGTTGGVSITGATTDTLTINGLTFDQAGEYRLRVTNSHGAVTSELARLTVERRPGALAPGILGQTSTNGGEVLAILHLADGSTLVGGSFTSIRVGNNALTRNRLARFLADGTLDPNFTPTINNTVRAIAQDSAGRVFIAGDFTANVTIGGVTANVTRIARLTSNLVLDTAFNTANSAGPNARVNAIAPVGDGSVYIGGVFTQIGSVTTGVNRMAKLGANGALDAAGFTSYATADVNTILRLDNGTLYVGGSSNTWNTPSLPGSPAARLVKLNANGSSRDSAFSSPAITTIVNRVIRLADGTLLVAGNNLGQPYLKRINANTGADATEPAYNITGHSSQVTGITQQADGKLLSGSLGVLKRSNLAGTEVEEFGAFNSTIHAIAVDSAGRIWVGGSFGTYNGQTQTNLAILAGGVYESRDGLLASQTLSFPAIANRTFGDTGNSLTLPVVTSDRGLTPITFSVTSGPATVSGNTLTITGAGTITVEAAQAGNATYRAATATQTFTVAKANQTITFAKPADRTITSPAFELTATASSGLPVTFAVSGPATLGGDGKTVTLTGATGTVTISANQAGNDNYHAAPDIVQTFEVTAGTPQSITFNTLANRVANAKPFTISATATSGLAVSFTVVSGPATISGNTVTLTGTPGTVTIRATQEGGAKGTVTYAAATPVEQSFEVTATPPTKTQKITFNAPAKATYGDAPITLGATADSGLPVAFELVSGPATLDGSTLTFTGAGKVVVRATQSGDGTYKPAAAVSRTITVGKAVLTVHFADVSRLVRQANPPLLIESYEGFIGADNESAITTPPTGTTKAAVGSAEGVYPITLKGGSSANYTFKLGSGSVTVLGFGGAYEALLVDDQSVAIGKLELQVASNALSYTGTLNLSSEPAAIALRGNLSASDGAAAQGAWSRAANPAKNLAALSLGFELSGDVLDGELARSGLPTLSIGSGSRVFVQALDAKKKKLPAPWTGAHTLVFRDAVPLDETDTRPLPLGAGHAAGTIAATGVMTTKGKLPDGTTLTGTTKADHSGLYRVFIRPYGKRLDSALAGELRLVSHPDQSRFKDRFRSADDTLLSWSKAETASDKTYPGGFRASFAVLLDPWLAPNTKTATVNGVTIPAGTLVQRLALGESSTASGTVDLLFRLPAAADLGARGEHLPESLQLSAKGAFTVPPPLPAKADNPAFTLKVTPATGAFSGSFTLSDIPEGKTKAVTRKVTISGTLRQGSDGAVSLGHGHFLLDPSVNDSDTKQVSGELILIAPVSE